MAALQLRQSAAVTISFGPFVSPTDGVTLQTGLVSAIDHATTGIKLSKNGGALTIRHQNVTASTYDAYGNYIVTLDTTDTNTLGTLRVQFAAAASCLVVFQDFEVINTALWDALYAASGGAIPNIAAGSASGIPIVGSAMTLTTAYDFAKGTAAMTEAYAANGAAPTPVQAIFAMHQMLMDFTIAGTTYTVKQLNNTTTAFVVTLDSATTPTAAART
jgi:hypothetical protein